jgi:subtilisin family serine protease
MQHPMQTRFLTFVFLFILSVGIFAGLPSLAQIPMNNRVTNRGLSAVPGELLVQFKEDANNDLETRAVGRIHGQLLEKVRGVRANSRTGDLMLVKYLPTPNLSREAAIAKLLEDESVEFAEPNWIYTTSATSNDPYYTNSSLWGMYGAATSPTNQFGSQAGQAWAAGYTGSNTMYVGVIDTGVQVGHIDLRDNIWINPYDPVNAIDDDGNGYIDDINGWDFNANDRTVYDGTQDNHGTHVAGTLGAKGGNSTGVAGVNWNVKLISAKFIDGNSGTLANAVRAIDYITDLKLRHGMNIVATNNSWGGGGFSRALQDAIERANQANILFIAAAGNNGSNNDTSPTYPANYPNNNVIAVAAIANNGSRPSFSNYGATTVHLGAPGSGVWSTVSGFRNRSNYASYNGTSMATPHVTGAAALYASAYPNASASQIKNAILSSAIPTPSLAGLTITGGRLAIYNALTK